MFIADYMTPKPITVSPDTSLSEAQSLMEHSRIRHLPVLDEGKRLVGILSDRDVRSAVGFDHELSEKLVVSEVMVAEPVTVSATDTMDVALGIFSQKKIGALPVLRAGQLVGVVTRSDILRAFAEVLGLDRPSMQIEVALPDGCNDLVHIYQSLLNFNGEIISSVVSRMRRDGREPSLYLRVAGDGAAKVEQKLREAALVVLKPELHNHKL